MWLLLDACAMINKKSATGSVLLTMDSFKIKCISKVQSNKQRLSGLLNAVIFLLQQLSVFVKTQITH